MLELDIEERLSALFPHDIVRPVPKGMRGADLVQEVCGSGGQVCGTIVWETKTPATGAPPGSTSSRRTSAPWVRVSPCW